MITSTENVHLGTTDLLISPIGLGTWSWGDRVFWAYGVTHSRQDVEEAFTTSVDAGINFIDTAEVYGFGGSEKLLANLLEKVDRELVITSKLFPYPWRVSTKSLIRGLKGSLSRLGVDKIDLYMMHWPLPPRRVERWTESLIRAHEEGLIGAIGTSNYSLPQMRRAQEVLDKHNLQLTANQIHYSLLHHEPQISGLIQACLEDNVTVISYSPLAQGLLTGKYTPGRPMPKGMMRLGNRSIIEEIQPLIAVMREMGAKFGDKSPAQVAINWAMSKSTIPIVGAKNRRQAAENVGSHGWSLSQQDVLALDTASQDIQLSFPMSKIARA